MLTRIPLAVLLFTAAGTSASPDPIVYDPERPERFEREQHESVTPIARRGVELKVDSGMVASPITRSANVGRPIQQSIWSTEIEIPDAAWVRLQFGEVELAPASETARESYIRITSWYDGHEQYLDRQSLREWSDTSAYFNGGRVRVEIMASPSNSGEMNRVEVVGATASEPTAFPRSICGPADDRVLSNDPRAARMMPIGCTGWLFGDQPHSFISAGHCGPDTGDVMQFNVPLSTSGGTPQNPAPQDQYPIDGSSVQGVNGGIGNDWAFYGTFANSNTGLAPRDAMGDSYILVDSVPSADGRPIRVTGYGSTTSPVDPSWYLVQKTHVGTFVDTPGTSLRYDPDTTGGNSGSAVYDDSTGMAIGVHTHAGCSSTGGSNQGTSLDLPALRSALANPMGITVPLGLDLDLVEARPDFIDPAGGDSISVNVVPDNGLMPSGNVTMWVDTGSGFSAVPMVNDGGNTFVGTFPSANCGDSVSYYFSAEDTGGGNWSLPTGGASSAWSAISAVGIDFVLNDDFESDSGWSVQDISISTGTWERAVPGNFGRSDPATDADGSGQCYVTQNGDEDDVDGGPTMLDTPVLDMTMLNDPVVSYARWHMSNGNDPFTFQISDDGGSTFTTAETVSTSVGWNTVEFRVADFAAITDQMVFRFTSEDSPNDSITESGVDAFRVFEIVCDSGCQADFNGDGDLDFFDVSSFINAFNAMDPDADVNGDGVHDFFDVSLFISQFSTGCP
jgi:V8-like Glu-specific endopeptidase